MDVISLRVENDQLIAEMAHGDTHILDIGLDKTVAAVIYQGDIVATDGHRILRYDGVKTEDITDRLTGGTT